MTTTMAIIPFPTFQKREKRMKSVAVPALAMAKEKQQD